jgi:6-phosphofructokinase 2
MNPSVDVGLRIEKLVPDAKLRSEDVEREPGGGGINVARGIHRLGGDVCALFNGDDLNGSLLESLLGEEGVPCMRLPIGNRVRESVLLEVRASGELYHIVMPGPEITDAEAAQALEAVASREPAPAYIVASGSLPGGVDEAFYARLARTARARGARLVLDSHGGPLRSALDEPVFLIKPNIREFAELAGDEPRDAAEAADRSREILARHPLDVLIVTLGDQGALMTTADEQVHMRAPSAGKVSPVGAGDSFIAACVHRLAAGDSLREALRAGVAGAAAAVTTPGTALFERGRFQDLFERTREVALKAS